MDEEHLLTLVCGMASIFTYEPYPPRVSSPWFTPPRVGPAVAKHMLGGLLAPEPDLLENCGNKKLQAEPQEGPIEYKLHLLLRPRQSFSTLSTGQYISGSHQSISKYSRFRSAIRTEPAVAGKHAIPTPTLHSRQNRLQHLTTQLLWRLQQSSPYHASSAADLVLPTLPEMSADLEKPLRPAKLLPGLEESEGALYEIGVSDDGTFVGLTEAEIDESLTNLRAMAASLGCSVTIIRTVIVGDCEWSEDDPLAKGLLRKVHVEKLWVAEVLVTPDTCVPAQDKTSLPQKDHEKKHIPKLFYRPGITYENEESQTDQLRISLTGSTTSGKSSLLGTLSTSTLDNGRGKSRLSLLKHRHEITSGVTSSVAPELIGYLPISSVGGERTGSVINYACGNVSSWTDIHNATNSGRLVLLTDSAGHPRYRRTTLRGLVSWDPHWTIYCVAANEISNPWGYPSYDSNGISGKSADLSQSHLELCLNIGLPLVVVITKFDLASKSGLRQLLNQILSTIKAAGRRPIMVKPTHDPDGEPNLQIFLPSEETEVKSMLTLANSDCSILVPIVITSAVTGHGISQLHALLRHLPTTSMATDLPSQLSQAAPETLFHVDEVFTRSHEVAESSTPNEASLHTSVSVLSGYLRYGSVSVGDELLLGPCTTRPIPHVAEIPQSWHAPPKSRHPSTCAATEKYDMIQSSSRPTSSIHSKFSENDTPSTEPQLWQSVRVTSIRNLRLPVRKLSSGQVGTIGITFSGTTTSMAPKSRKGMVLAMPTSAPALDSLLLCGGFQAVFDGKCRSLMEPGVIFTIYNASIRASVKIIKVQPAADIPKQSIPFISTPSADTLGIGIKGTKEIMSKLIERSEGTKLIEVAFQFVIYPEWIERGTRVLVMPRNSTDGRMGLEGFVGTVTQTLR